jgi:hypothetical protein
MRLLAATRITNSDSRSGLRFTTTGGGTWKVWDRFLALDERLLVHLGNVCGTCEFFFRYVDEQPINGFELDSLRVLLEHGLDTLEPAVSHFCSVVPNGDYIACLFEGHLAASGTPACPDYFTSEQTEAWGRDNQEIANGRCDYYRGDSVVIADAEKLFEFVVPLTPNQGLQRSRVDHYVRLLASGIKPTAVAISVLDVKSSMDWPEDGQGNELEPTFPTHWCLAHYLLDGHHKVAAAAESGHVVTLLSFIAFEPSWTRIDDLILKYHAGLPGQTDDRRDACIASPSRGVD